MKMNKKADITVTILVLGVVGICILTILSFVGVKNSVDDDFLGIGLIETMNSIGEEMIFYSGTEFKGDYGSVFERGNVKIIMQGNTMEGSYYKKKCSYGVFNCADKKIVWIEYKKQ